MMEFSPALNHILSAAAHYKYALLFLGAIVEGPILTVVVGFLLHSGLFNPLLAFAALGLGDLVADIGWYYIGYFFAEPALRRHGKFLGLTPPAFEKIKSIFHRRHSLILFVSKITMGFGMALGTLMTAGAVRIPILAYFSYNALGEIVYVAVLMSLGYYLGHFYGALSSGFRFISLLGIILAVGLAVYGFSRYIKSKALSL